MTFRGLLNRKKKVIYFVFQTGHLAMETLLSLTSKRAGDWFKEELRLLGGLDHIVDTGNLSECLCICICKNIC